MTEQFEMFEKLYRAVYPPENILLKEQQCVYSDLYQLLYLLFA